MPDAPPDDGGAFRPRFSPRPNRAAELPWQPFGADAFAAARAERRPILLSISAVWCHWCHVMDEETYSDPAVLDLVRERYVAVRVDRDQRPEVDRRYNQGGWPTTCILNAAGSVLWGGTYVPAPRMADVLASVADAYRGDASLVDALPAGQSAQGPAAQAGASGGPGDIVDAVLVALGNMEDRRHGGFGRDGPKFPQVEALRFLAALAPWPGGAADSAQAMLGRALDGMLAGDLEDSVEGGFYRYATRPDWREPHFEKMLADNAALISLYLLSGSRTGEARWLEAGRRALMFVDRVMWQEDLTAYAMSQDADEAYARMDGAGRARAKAPYLDRVVYADANLAMVETLVDAWAVLGRSDCLARAQRLWDGLIRRLYRQGEGVRHFDAGVGESSGLETMDQVQALSTALALWPLAQPRDREVARALAEEIMALGGERGQLREPAAGWEGPPSWQRLGSAPMLPESGRAARCLRQLGRLLGEPRYDQAARGLVERFGAQAGAYGPFAADIARAAQAWRPPVTVAIGGVGAPEAALDFIAAARRSAIEPLDVTVAMADEHCAGAAAEDGHVRAYPCLGSVCQAPVEHSAALPDRLRRLVAQASSELVW